MPRLDRKTEIGKRDRGAHKPRRFTDQEGDKLTHNFTEQSIDINKPKLKSPLQMERERKK